jgi:MFS transporter, MHS family, shikimate and dehydroshikimate transport protein
MTTHLPAVAADSPVATTATSVSLRAAVSSFIGAMIEYYDYYLYGLAATLVFPRIFFSDLAPAAATLASLATFSIAFVLRPLGGVVFGHFGDRISRKKMLVLTLFLMGISTGLIGLLPTYAQIGVWAPVLLIGTRCVQGFALGGEWGGAALMAVEHAPAGRRGLYGGVMQMGVPAGILVATAAFRAASSVSDASFFGCGSSGATAELKRDAGLAA